jgi:hypothetical protein
VSVICFVDGGAAEVTRFAARQVADAFEQKISRISHIACDRNAEPSFERGWPTRGSDLLSARDLIADVRRMRHKSEHVVLDASGASQQTVALAVGLSDLVLTPLCLDDFDAGSFKLSVDLVRIVGENLRRSENHCVFLTTRRRAPLTEALVKITALLAMKGLATLPVALAGWQEPVKGVPGDIDDRLASDHSAFAYSVFDLVSRQCVSSAYHSRSR